MPTPKWVWKGASYIFANNATGTVIKVGAQQGNVWLRIEKVVLDAKKLLIVTVK
jgi:hypothetical protein